jgi:hypothetical protein
VLLFYLVQRLTFLILKSFQLFDCRLRGRLQLFDHALVFQLKPLLLGPVPLLFILLELKHTISKEQSRNKPGNYFFDCLSLLVRVDHVRTDADAHRLSEHHLARFHFRPDALQEGSLLHSWPLGKVFLFALVHTLHLLQFLFMPV